jgi:MFS transporter, DHA1 family, tetracycline resistance protein
MSEPDQTATPRPAALVFILITVGLDMLALGMIIPILPKLVKDLVGGNTARAAEIYGLFGSVWALMQFIFSPMLGALSDRFGRRPVILLSNLGLGLDYIVMALAPSVGWLFLGRVISGITSASASTAFAYITDVTPPEKRAAGFGTLSAAFGLGFVLGPAIGGMLGNINPRLPFWVAAGFSFLNYTYGLFVLPESLSQECRERFVWRGANPIGSLELLRSRRELFGLAIVNFFSNLAYEALPTTLVLYMIYRYGWNERTIGLATAAVGVCSALVGALLVEPFVGRFGERRTMLVGLLFGAAGFAIYGLATTSVVFWVALPINALWGLSGPPMGGMMTQQVDSSEQGKLQGALSSLRGVALMIGPLVFTNLFASSIEANRDWFLPGAPYLLAALMVVGSAVIGWQVTRSHTSVAATTLTTATEEVE